MRRNVTRWLLRGLAVVAVTAVIALWVWVHPLPESPPPTLTPTVTPTVTPSPTPTWTATPAPSPTLPPSPPQTPTPPTSPIEEPAATITATATFELAGRVEEHTYFSPTTGEEEQYRVYLPPGYDQSDDRYPVLYLFHGWPYEAAHWNGLGTEETADAAIQYGTLPPFIIVQPKGSEGVYVNTSGGDRSFEGQVVNDLIPHVEGTYRTWAEREGRAVGGISRGGVWALEIAFSYPDLFAAVGAHSPALSVNMAPSVYDPFYLLENPGVAALRIYLDAGDADWAREGTEELHQALDAQGILHEFDVHSGGHSVWLWSAHVVEYLAFYASGWPASQ